MSNCIPVIGQNDSKAPNWIDELFVHKCLQNHWPDKKIIVHNFQVQLATAKGENYASCIFRITAAFSDGRLDEDDKLQSRSIIIKLALPDGSPAVKYLTQMRVNEKEMEMYQHILPRIKQMLQNTNYCKKIFADTYFVSHTNQAMCFEDLTVCGYQMVMHRNGFDMLHAKMVLSKLAKFHAAAAVLHELQPDIFRNFQHGMINRVSDGLNPMYTTQLDALIEIVGSWTNYEYYAEKLRQLQPNLLEKGRCAFDAQPHHFNTLIHGDIWRNNVMIQYNAANQLENAALIDFQFCCWTSPAIDLQYFFNTSLEEDLRLHRQDELVQYYHGELSATLKRLNYRQHVPTLHEFQIQFMEKCFYGFTSGCLIQPFMLNEHTDDADIEALLFADERAKAFKRLTLQSATVHQNLRKLLPYYDRKGMFD